MFAGYEGLIRSRSLKKKREIYFCTTALSDAKSLQAFFRYVLRYRENATWLEMVASAFKVCHRQTFVFNLIFSQ